MPINPSGWWSSTTTATSPRRRANSGGSASSACWTAARTCSSVSEPRTEAEDRVPAVSALHERMSAAMEGRLPGLFGVEIVSIEHGATETRLDLRPEHLAPNDFLHAGTVITLA